MTTRRTVIAGGAGAALLGALGYRAWDRGVFSADQGRAFAPWRAWQGHAGEGPRRLLHAAILASNAHGSQPWLFAPSGHSIAIYADRSRNLGSTDPFRRELYISLGCAVANLRLAAFKQGLACDFWQASGRLDHSPPNTLIKVAEVDLWPLQNTGSAVWDINRLADAIPYRHTNRGPYFADKTITPNASAKLFARYDSATRIVAVVDRLACHELGAVIVEATERFIADKEMTADSARWFRTGSREILAHRDGVTTDTAGLSPLMNAAAKLLPDVDAESANRFWLASTRDMQIPTAPAFGIIFVPDRLEKQHALGTGVAWQRCHLTATAFGLAAQPLNQPVEMMDRDTALGRHSEYGRELRKIAGVKKGDPTFIFRLGYAERPALPSPRRRLDDVVRQNGFA